MRGFSDGGTSKIQHQTSSFQRGIALLAVRCSALDVGCSLFPCRLVPVALGCELSRPPDERRRNPGLLKFAKRGRPPAFFLALPSFAAQICHAAEAQKTSGESLLKLTDLFWALFLLVAFGVVAIIWVGRIRRSIRQHTESTRQREAALEEHYRELFENAHDIIFTHDLDGNLTSLNRAGEQILGYSRVESAKQNFANLVSPDSLELFHGALTQLKEGRPGAHCELEMRAKDGRRVVLRVNLRLQQLGGKAKRVQGIAWDISGLKEAEEALRESEQRLRRSLEERVQLGRDLHDGIIQSIYAIGLGLGESRRLVREKPVEAETRLGKAMTDLNLVIRDVRNFIVGLEPEALKGNGFRSAVQSLVTGMSETDTARFSFEIDPQAADRLSDRQATHLLQIAREAMSNSLRHARAGRTAVVLTLRNEQVQLEVRDDGVGFDPQARIGTGHGLRNISSRAQELGGASQIDSAPGKGTTVNVIVPVNQSL